MTTSGILRQTVINDAESAQTEREKCEQGILLAAGSIVATFHRFFRHPDTQHQQSTPQT